MPDFDAVIERRNTGSSKWSKFPSDVLPMWVADMDFPVAPEIITAIAERLSHPLLGYGVASKELIDRIIREMDEKYGWIVRPDEIVFLPGVEPGFNMALRAFLQEKDGLLVQTPIYRPILNAAHHWNLIRREAPLVARDGAWTMNSFALEQELKKSKAFLFCNPHNPTGKVFSDEELEAISSLCSKHDVLVISDEIHCDLLFDGRKHRPFATLSKDSAARSITLMSASKTYNIAGLKAAFAIIQNPELRISFSGSRSGMVDSVNILGLAATLAAYEKAGTWKAELMAYLQGNRDYLSREIDRRFPSMNLIKAEGTFLAWLDASRLELRPDPQTFFLEHGRVGFSAGSEFGDNYAECFRLNFGCPRSLLSEGLLRMELAIQRGV